MASESNEAPEVLQIRVIEMPEGLACASSGSFGRRSARQIGEACGVAFAGVEAVVRRFIAEMTKQGAAGEAEKFLEGLNSMIEREPDEERAASAMSEGGPLPAAAKARVQAARDEFAARMRGVPPTPPAAG